VKIESIHFKYMQGEPDKEHGLWNQILIPWRNETEQYRFMQRAAGSEASRFGDLNNSQKAKDGVLGKK
jgi:hypothetical protein